MEIPFCATKAPPSGVAQLTMPKMRPLPLALLASLAAANAYPVFTFAAEVDAEQRGKLSLESLLAQATHLRDQKRYVDALAICERALTHSPTDTDAFRLQVLLLSDIGNSYRAWQLYRTRPDVFDAGQRNRFELDLLARLIGWSQTYSEDEDRPLAEAQHADAAIARYLDANAIPDTEMPARLRFDRLILLNRLGRHQQVADEYHRLQDSGQSLPGYAMGSVGDSLLALRMPEIATRLFEGALAGEPDNAKLQVQLAYARLESEQPDSAIAGLRGYSAREPSWKYALGAKAPYPNWARYDADTTLAMLSAYSEDLPTAQEAMERFVAIAPGNAGLQTSLGSLYQMRGWAERGLERYRMASTLDERNIGARIGQVEALTALDRTDLARPVHAELLQTYPDQPQVQRMDAQWRTHQGWQWRLHAAGGRSEANDAGAASISPLGSREGHYGLEINSPLMADRWRLTGMTDRRWADFQGQRVHDRRHGLGVSYAFDRLQASAGINHASVGPAGNGVDLHAGWRLNDVWHVGIDVRRHDPDASLQARAAGITADSMTLSVNYARNERTSLALGLSQFRYEDQNERSILSASLQKRVVSEPRLLVQLFGGFYASRNTLQDVPYFNPARDASLEAGTRFDHLLWRDYDRHLRQRLSISAGPYWQEGYGSAWVPSVRYGQELQFMHGKVLEYGINWSRPVYDGQREEHLGVDMELRWGG